MNEVGQVVGASATDSTGVVHAFLWDNENGMQNLETLGGTNSEARAINNSGFVVGISDVSPLVAHAFLWQPGSGMTDLFSNCHPGSHYLELIHC